MRSKRALYYLLAVAIPFCLTVALSNYYFLAVNTTDSLPYTLFLVKKGEHILSSGDFIVFKKQNLPKFEKPMIKMVAGVEGDVVSINNSEFSINGIYLDKAKGFSKTGVKTKLSSEGVIPHGRYFVYAPHKDSFDSRYAEIGWIDRADVIGRAYVIF